MSNNIDRMKNFHDCLICRKAIQKINRIKQLADEQGYNLTNEFNAGTNIHPYQLKLAQFSPTALLLFSSSAPFVFFAFLIVPPKL